MKLRTDLVLRHLGDEYIVVDPGQEMVDMSKIYTLNETAALVWETLQGKEFTVASIVAVLTDNYDVELGVAELDAEKLRTDFMAQGLLVD